MQTRPYPEYSAAAQGHEIQPAGGGNYISDEDEVFLFQMKGKILLIWNSSSLVLSRVMMEMMTESIII